MKRYLRISLFLAGWLAGPELLAAEAPPTFTFDSLPAARFALDGPVGARVQANVENWLLTAPQANPGMLGMFHMRDRPPSPSLMPWAGEFVGKYLISAVQALRLSEHPRLRPQVAAVVAELIATQADDGYLGPFPKQERLLGHWDLWGHYHVLLALVLWHEQSGDAAALAAARKAADLVCGTYLDSGRRVLDAGDPEMNMTILTGMAMLHRLTGEARYLRMAREVEKDWEHAGDYLRAGLDGREYFRSPRPRWESLHDLQGLVEMWRITGESRYREAFEHHWRSIRRWDRRNTGGFSSGEQATGNPYAPTAIETCCTVAWMALTVDYLRLTGSPGAADDLELATLNGGLGAQHPSGRWWTYNTPMDGAREASAHTIVFQARAGTPELNCCSVNGPRILGMLSEWAVMSATDGLVVNWLGAGRFTAPLPDGVAVTITSSDDAWRDGHTELRISTAATRAFTLRVRVPSWAQAPAMKLDGVEATEVAAGKYVALHRAWSGAHRLELSLRPALRFVPGANEAAGKVSLYRGPLLLAFDQTQNAFDEDAIPAVSLKRLGDARATVPAGSAMRLEVPWRPWLVVEVPAADGRALRLVDFASAGANGTRYRSWLPAQPTPPAPAFTQVPPDGARVPPGPVQFRWRGPRARGTSYRIEVSSDPAFPAGTGWSTNTAATRLVLDVKDLAPLAPREGAPLYWRVVSRDSGGETVADVPPAQFQLDSKAPPQSLPPEAGRGPNREVIMHSLRGEAPPVFGELKSAKLSARGPEGTEVNGVDQMLVYSVGSWPEDDFTVRVRVLIKEQRQGHLGQVFSAWCAGIDDPLRIVVDGGKLFARVEAGGAFSTPGLPVEMGRWYNVAAMKHGARLTLYVDGRATGSCAVPEFLSTSAEACALGGNPRFSGDEFLAARLADFCFDARALAPEEIEAWAGAR